LLQPIAYRFGGSSRKNGWSERVRDVGRDPPDLLRRSFVRRPPRQHPGVLEHDLEPGLARDHPQPAFGQAEVGHDLGPQHARDVGGRRGANARRDLLGHAGAPDDLAALEHDRPQAGAREVERGGQPVVAPAHDRDVVSQG
jgi:hypothetical protein